MCQVSKQWRFRFYSPKPRNARIFGQYLVRTIDRDTSHNVERGQLTGPVMLRRILLAAVEAAAVGFARLLVADHSGGCPVEFVPGSHARLRQRPHGIQCRRVFLLPCGTWPGTAPVRLVRPGVGVAVRDLLRAEYLARSGRRHRPMDRSRIRGRGDQRYLSRPVIIISRPFPIPLTVMPSFRRRPRPVCLSEDLAAVSGKVRDHDVPFPFNVRRNIGIWKLLFMGARLHCPIRALSAMKSRRLSGQQPWPLRECHSPRNFLGGIVAAQRFAGGPNPEGKGWVPNITQKARRLERERHHLFS